ncbi:MAG: GTPase HflX [Candidatus Margulisiibacteriota bacterium]
MSLPRALLLGANLSKPSLWSIDDSLNELAELARTADIEVAGKVYQNREAPHPKYYLGPGKLDEIFQRLAQENITLIITDDELSPSQNKAMESFFKIKVIDRTGLILDIFAKHARTHEAQLQVELAQLEYLLPRLTRMWTHLSRLGGGIGTRGPGEKQLEVDKRQIRTRMSALKKKLEVVARTRKTKREKRNLLPVITGAIVGYTNAGKSTLLNALTSAEVLSEDKLFATLDPTTKQLKLASNDSVLLTDTVGFIQKLPHQLVTSFHATLEEVVDAQFLLHVVDVSHPSFPVFIQTSQTLLKSLHADHVEQLFVFNKRDKLKSDELESLQETLAPFKPYVLLSALQPESLPQLREAIEKVLSKHHKQFKLSIPYNRMEMAHLFHQFGKVLEESYEEKNLHLTVDIHKVIGEKLIAQLYEPKT